MSTSNQALTKFQSFNNNSLNATKKRRERRLGEAKSKRKSGAYRDK